MVHLERTGRHLLVLHVLCSQLDFGLEWVERAAVLVEHGGRSLDLAYNVQGLFCVPQHHFARLFESSHLDIDNFADTLLVVLDIFNAVVVVDHA